MNIVIVGLMGVGKSTVGKELSERINSKFYDTDKEIEKETEKSITEIFELSGEKYFRKKEVEILSKVIKEKAIIATGGGIIENNQNYELLNSHKYVIFLDASVNTILEHLSNDKQNRPLLSKSNNIESTIKHLMNKRVYKYKEVSDIIINVDNKDVDEVVSEILVYIG